MRSGWLWLLLSALVAGACRASSAPIEGDLGAKAERKNASPTAAPSFGSTVPPLSSQEAAALTSSRPAPSAAPPIGSALHDESPDEIHGPEAASKLAIDEPIELAAAGPAAADARGVVLVDKNDELTIAARHGALSRDPRKKMADFALIRAPASDFFPLAKSPLIERGKAYWVSGSQLVRRSLEGGPLEVLAKDARPGTRVAGLDLSGAPALAVYVSGPKQDDTPRSRLWVEGSGTLELSPEGSAANSVAAADGGGDLMAIAIDARSGMTPLHGRRVRFANGKPELGPDVVIWVGSSAQSLTEVFAVSTPLGARALLPIERDVSHFGLALFELGAEPRMDPKLYWRTYPNGIDLAPAAAAEFCGSSFAAYVRPVSAEPGASELLEIAEITANGLGAGSVVGRAHGFANVSLASAPNGAVLAYVADRLTFATTLRCKR